MNNSKSHFDILIENEKKRMFTKQNVAFSLTWKKTE